MRTTLIALLILGFAGTACVIEEDTTLDDAKPDIEVIGAQCSLEHDPLDKAESISSRAQSTPSLSDLTVAELMEDPPFASSVYAVSEADNCRPESEDVAQITVDSTLDPDARVGSFCLLPRGEGYHLTHCDSSLGQTPIDHNAGKAGCYVCWGTDCIFNPWKNNGTKKNGSIVNDVCVLYWNSGCC